MTLIPLGIMAASGGGAPAYDYWLLTADNAAAQGLASPRQSGTSLYAYGRNFPSSLFMKFADTSAIQETNYLGVDRPETIAVSSSGATYAQNYSGSPAGSDLTKFNANGTVDWSYQIQPGTLYPDDVKLDDSENAYSLHHYYDKVYWFKTNSSGVVQWRYSLGQSPAYGSHNAGGGLTLTSSAIFSAGDTVNASGGSYSNMYVRKSSLTDGSHIWTSIIDPGNSTYKGFLNDIDSYYNSGLGIDVVVACGYAYGLTPDWGGVFVYRSDSSALQKAYWYYQSGVDTNVLRVFIDSTNNYLYLWLSGGIIVKSTFGIGTTTPTIIWQRKISGSGLGVYDFSLDQNDDMLITGELSNSPFVAKLPGDGSLTGVYNLNGVDITYATNSTVNVTSDIPSTNTTTSWVSSNSFSYTYNANSFTETPASPTATITEVI